MEATAVYQGATALYLEATAVYMVAIALYLVATADVRNVAFPSLSPCLQWLHTVFVEISNRNLLRRFVSRKIRLGLLCCGIDYRSNSAEIREQITGDSANQCVHKCAMSIIYEYYMI